jgi:serine/threonine-protein kinase HipA
MAKKGKVLYKDQFAGIVEETENGFRFTYDKQYLAVASAVPISLTMPLREQPYESPAMLPFFDGLIPEGWLLDIATQNWKINPRDRMSLLLLFCTDCLGAVSVVPMETQNAG